MATQTSLVSQSIAIPTGVDGEAAEGSPAPLPPLPPLSATDLLQAFDPDAEELDGTTVDIPGLAFLGRGVLDLVVRGWLFDHKRDVDVAELEASKEEYTSTAKLAAWTSAYNDFAPLHHGQPLNSSGRARAFLAYAGALFSQDGLNLVQSWIGDLILFSNPGASSNGTAPPAPATTNGFSTTALLSPKRPPSLTDLEPPAKRARMDEPADPAFDNMDGDPLPLPDSPKWGTHYKLDQLPDQMLNNVPKKSENKSWLQIFNENCAQKKVQPTWDIVNAGQSHQALWSATLKLPVYALTQNAMRQTKQGAKEEAAKLACIQLHWSDPSQRKR